VSVALYRKYRSATFADLIGQDHIATVLRNEVRRGEVSHAYLFAGIRGTGKTSTARILARAVNCLDLQDGEPCNRCDACLEVLGGGAVDVLEIDAASNRGIDEMRELREKVKFLPALLRRKVYIVDEAHMLTTEAWNAFLKTLEEPPPHVLFVLATTEPHKVPETVRSRVQRFDFRRVSSADIAAHLSRIAAAEEVPVESDAVDLLARAGQGSVRDAISLLDQAIATGERPLGVTAVRRALGLADPAAVGDMMRGVAASDAAAALRGAAAAFEAGADARQLLREGSRLARAAELVALGYPEGAELAATEEALCSDLATMAPRGLWVEALERFSEAEINLRQPVDARLQVELCLLRLCSGPASGSPGIEALEHRVAALEAVVGGRPGGRGGRAAAVEEVVGDPDSARGPALVQVETAPEFPAEQDAGDGDTPAPVASVVITRPATAEAWEARWPDIVEAVNRRDPMLAGVLRSCRPIEGSATHVVVGAPYGFHLERLRDVQKAPLLAEAVAEVTGGPCTVEAVFAPASVAPQGQPAAAQETGAVDATQAALQAFPGSRLTGSRLRDPGVDGG
jgi:DNA polymerase III subunit gamma/tau